MRRVTPFFAAPVLLCACEPQFDDALLEEYRAAIPTEERLSASAPIGSSERDVGDPALFPAQAVPMALAINGAVVGHIEMMKTIVDLPPTAYNSETGEFLWGPTDDEGGFGTVAAYIVALPEEDDFDYAYALLRGVDDDLGAMTPVIWGAASPDPLDEDDGTGVTLWDFEANHAFLTANDPNVGETPLDRGRFVAVYGAGPDENDPQARAAFVYAVFNDFVPSDTPEAPPADAEYLYGHYEGSDALTLDFLDFAVPVDVFDGGSATPEDVEIRMAFLEEGAGRAEVLALGGDLPETGSAEGIECWDGSIDRLYLGVVVDDGTSQTTYTEPSQGDSSLCVVPDGTGGFYPLFEGTLESLGIPTLSSVDPDLQDALWCVAENGVTEDGC